MLVANWQSISGIHYLAWLFQAWHNIIIIVIIIIIIIVIIIVIIIIPYLVI